MDEIIEMITKWMKPPKKVNGTNKTIENRWVEKTTELI